jgi:hypothetical protein
MAASRTTGEGDIVSDVPFAGALLVSGSLGCSVELGDADVAVELSVGLAWSVIVSGSA